MKNKNNISYNSVVDSTEESVYNSAKDWTEYLISEIKKTKKLRVMCIHGAENIDEMKKLSEQEKINNRAISLGLYIYQIEEVINIGKEGIHDNHKNDYKKIIKYIKIIKDFLPEVYYHNKNKYHIDEDFFSVVLKKLESKLNSAIHMINKSGLIYKFVRKRDFEKEAFKNEQDFLTV